MKTGSPFKQAAPLHSGGGILGAARPAFTQASWGSGAGFGTNVTVAGGVPHASFGAFTPANIGGGSFAAKGMSTAGTGGFLAFALMLGLAHAARKRAIFAKLNAAKRREYAARNEMKRFKNVYENIQVTNPYSNLRNPFEDMSLTVDKRKAQFERDQFQQQQANMLSGLQQAGGGSGMADRVKMLSQMGIEAGMRSATSIGQQESQVKLLRPQMFAKIDQLERSGRNISAMFERDKYAKLMGMSQAEMFAYMEGKFNQDKARSDNFSNTMSQFTGMAGSTASRWQDIPSQMPPTEDINEFNTEQT